MIKPKTRRKITSLICILLAVPSFIVLIAEPAGDFSIAWLLLKTLVAGSAFAVCVYILWRLDEYDKTMD